MAVVRRIAHLWKLREKLLSTMSAVLAESQNRSDDVVGSPKKIIANAALNARITPYIKLSEKASRLEAETASVGGVVLRTAENMLIPSRGKTCISTEIQMAIPHGFYGRIAPLDSLAEKHMIQAGAGVIDSDYRGTVKVLLFNHGKSDVAVAEGDEIAKIVFEEICPPSEIEWSKVEENATLPVVGSQYAAGADLTSAEECVVPAGSKRIVKTNLSATYPESCYGRIAPRSGLAAKKFIHVLGGVCASQGEPIQVTLFNHSQEDFKIATGDRIAQFILQRTADSQIQNEKIDENGEPQRKSAKTAFPKFAEILAPSEFSVDAEDMTTISVNIDQAVPEGYYARVAPLTSLAEDHSIDIGGGVLSTTGATNITIFNYGNEAVKFEKDQSIAYLIFEKAEAPVFKQVESLEETSRGEGGFGSTGVASS